jgi:hypothetical protein
LLCDIRFLFTDTDIDHMKPRGLDLTSYDAVENYAGNIYGQVSGFLGIAVRSLHSFMREHGRGDASFVRSNLLVLLQVDELLQYAATCLTLCASSDHIGRRLSIIERERSKLFPRSIKFALQTSSVLGLMIVFVPRYLPLPGHLLPAEGWHRNAVFAAAVLAAPLAVMVLSPVLRLMMLALGGLVPGKTVRDPELWWEISFLSSPGTSRSIRTPAIFQFLLFAGPYVLLTCSLIGCAAYLPLHRLLLLAAAHPGQLTPAGSVFMVRLVCNCRANRREFVCCRFGSIAAPTNLCDDAHDHSPTCAPSGAA